MLFLWAFVAEEEKNQMWVRGNPPLSRPQGVMLSEEFGLGRTVLPQW